MNPDEDDDTVKGTVAETAPLVAVMARLPAELAVTIPAALIAAPTVYDEVQVTCRLKSDVEPSL